MPNSQGSDLEQGRSVLHKNKSKQTQPNIVPYRGALPLILTPPPFTKGFLFPFEPPPLSHENPIFISTPDEVSEKKKKIK